MFNICKITSFNFALNGVYQIGNIYITIRLPLLLFPFLAVPARRIDHLKQATAHDTHSRRHARKARTRSKMADLLTPRGNTHEGTNSQANIIIYNYPIGPYLIPYSSNIIFYISNV